MRTIEHYEVIFNIAQMRKVITGQEMDLDNLQKYDVGSMTYDELHDLQNSLVSDYNEAIERKTKLKELTEEFNNMTLMPIFEQEVVDKRTGVDDWIIFDIGIEGEEMYAQHVALNQEEEDSPKVAYKSIEIDVDFSLDENLQEMWEECRTAILDSEFYDFKEEQ